MLGAMSHPQLISSQLPEQNMSTLLNNGNSLADDFLAHEGMISTVLGDCIKEDGAVIGDKHEKVPLMGWGSMLEQVNVIFISLFFIFTIFSFRIIIKPTTPSSRNQLPTTTTLP